ncbi:MAG TPA: DMT family transporter [Candidatus Paceibacterota bacterium]|nr:DMT family transporter [Candidatus Paceibacterota bacterium]
MSWFLIAVIAQFALGSAAVFDKLLLKKAFPNPLGYTFWLGILGLAALALTPFGFGALGITWMLVALAAGATFVIAILLEYYALFDGEASGTLPLIGALSPIATLAASYLLLGIGLDLLECIAFAILVIGGFLLAMTAAKNVRVKVAMLALVAAACFGLTNALTKAVFLHANFVTGFVWIKIGGALMALLFLALPAARRKILHPASKDEFHNRWGYFLNRGWAGAGSILFYIAFAIGNPALVSSTASLQNAFIFLGGWLLLKERFRGWSRGLKIAALALILIGVSVLGLLDYFASHPPSSARPIAWGVTFSEKFSMLMGLDWKANYDAILNDLHAKHLRLVAYWDLVEPQKGQFDFADLDYQMNEAAKNHADVVLVIGEKAPRWPECHYPSWVTEPTDAGRRTELPPYLRAVVDRYKNSPALLYWQVENEPFLTFGNCPPMDANSLTNEISLVKSLDPAHPILTTDGGEFGLWYEAAKQGDVFGTTMYRRVHSDTWGYFDYHLPPSYFYMKTALIRWLTGKPDETFVNIELGTEPWLKKGLYETTVVEQLRHFDLPFFEDTIAYAKNTGFNSYYLWGAEWWYWMKTKQNDPSFWNYAESVMRQSTGATP